MNDSDVYTKVERLAWEANVPVSRLCSEAKVSQATVWRWKNKTSSPNVATLQKLEEASARLAKNNKFLG